MKIRFWGTRGSLSSAGPDTVKYGGDTSSIEVSSNGRTLILDAGSGIRALGMTLVDVDRIDILLTHLHMDHVQGLPFLGHMYDQDVEIHLWGPGSDDDSLRRRISQYLSPPLFPISVRDLPNVHFHNVSPGEFQIDEMRVTADLICHPGQTLGYRLDDGHGSLTYMPDHEPALGHDPFPGDPTWTSGFELARGSDILIHDSQYTDEEYSRRVGWGHSTFSQLAAFTEMTEARRLVTFHHDPAHDDALLDHEHTQLAARLPDVELTPGTAGLIIDSSTQS